MMKYHAIKRKRSLIFGDKAKIVIRTKRSSYDARLTVGERTYTDMFNDEEPFDRKTHVFVLPENEVSEESVLRLELKKHKRGKITYSHEFKFGEKIPADEKALIEEYDNGLVPISSESETVCDGVTYTHTLYKDKNGAPVHVFVTDIDTAYASLYVGTPNDGYESVRVRATIPDMVGAAKKNGKNVVAAVNADFFDIFGDFHPSGLCVKNGRVIANPKSRRNFIAKLKNGTHVITNLDESPDIIPSIEHAAAGLQMIVKDGTVYEYAPLEPFSETRHPRTAAGVRGDGSVILIVVDGRIPDYSNGATLVDLARLMISFGAERAINLDGGGSSAMYTVKNGEPILHSRPADLFRPKAKLIRKDYNGLLVVKDR